MPVVWLRDEGAFVKMEEAVERCLEQTVDNKRGRRIFPWVDAASPVIFRSNRSIETYLALPWFATASCMRRISSGSPKK